MSYQSYCRDDCGNSDSSIVSNLDSNASMSECLDASRVYGTSSKRFKWDIKLESGKETIPRLLLGS